MVRKRDENKVLTFVDMSHLSYLSKSVSTNNQFLKHHEHKARVVVIPENTKAAIVEDVSEEDYNSEEAEQESELNSPIETEEFSVQEVLTEIFE